MNLDELISRAIPIYPHHCRIKQAQLTQYRVKMRELALQLKKPGIVQVGSYKLNVTEEMIQVYSLARIMFEVQ